MIFCGSGLAIELKLYVMAPIWTPSIYESIIFAPNALLSGRATSAIFPKSRLVISMVFIDGIPSEGWWRGLQLQPGPGCLGWAFCGISFKLVQASGARSGFAARYRPTAFSEPRGVRARPTKTLHDQDTLERRK